jgi:DNA-binding XRE family transcriptional regulator
MVVAAVHLQIRAGLNQTNLAQALGREQNLIGRIETGQRRIDLVEWVGICRACKVDPEAEIARLVRQIKPLVPQRRR